MDSSRRDFLRCCLAGGSAPAAAAGFCHSGSTDSTMKPVVPGKRKFEPAYIKTEKEGRLGKIETGYAADFVVFDDAFQVKEMILSDN